MTVRDGHECTDLGNARRFRDTWKQLVRYVPAWGWLVWDGKRFKPDDRGFVQELAKEITMQIFEAAGAQLGEARGKELAKWAMRSQEEPRIRRMLALAQTDPVIAAGPEDFDAVPTVLNVQNGVLDLGTGELIPHDHRYFMTKIAGCEYDPAASAPRFLAFLEQILPDPDVRAFVQRAVGYSLTGLTNEQVLFLLCGAGANGKSVLLRILEAALGGYARTADFSSFLARRSDGPRNDIASLLGSRFVSAIEVDEGRRMAEALVKTLTGGDRIRVRFLYRESFEATPTFKVWLAANHRPEIRGNDYAIWRRIRLIPFNVETPPDQQDPNLGDKLMEELPGVLRWAVVGCTQWQRQGLAAPEAVTKATNAYRQESDPLGEWLDENCVLEVTATESARALYDDYTEWCEQNGEKPMSGTKFGRRLEDAGYSKVKSSTIKRVGLRLTGRLGQFNTVSENRHMRAHEESSRNGSQPSQLSRDEADEAEWLEIQGRPN